jgi:hypothetical protein
MPALAPKRGRAARRRRRRPRGPPRCRPRPLPRRRPRSHPPELRVAALSACPAAWRRLGGSARLDAVHNEAHLEDVDRSEQLRTSTRRWRACCRRWRSERSASVSLRASSGAKPESVENHRVGLMILNWWKTKKACGRKDHLAWFLRLHTLHTHITKANSSVGHYKRHRTWQNTYNILRTRIL